MKNLYCLVLVLLSFIWTGTTASAQEAYAALSDDNTILTFYYDTNKESRNGMSVRPFDSGEARSWDNHSNSIETVVFDKSFAAYRPTSTAYWFFGCNALTTISGFENLTTDDITDMRSMFQGCSSLTSLDVSNFNTDNVTNMREMFMGCSKLTSLDLSNFNTRNVTDMSYMFYGCSNLANLDVSNFNTENVADMAEMFSNCKFTSLDVSNFNTGKVTNMRSMFYYCTGLTSLDVSNFNTSKATNISSMFRGCSSLTTLDLSNFNTENVTDMSAMFHNCSKLTNLDLSSFKTGNVTNMLWMFFDCSNLKTIYVGIGNWDVSNVTSSGAMFLGCNYLIGDEETTYDSKYNDKEYAHIDGGADNPGYLSQGPVKTYAALSEDNTVLTFYHDGNKESRHELSVGPFDSDDAISWSALRSSITTVVFDKSFAKYKPTSTAYWFFGCNALTTITGIENLETNKVTDMSWMFNGCSGLTSLDLSNFNTGNVTGMKQMFAGCSSLTSLDVTSFNTSSVTSMASMFQGCSSLTNLDFHNFNLDKVRNMNSMFEGCSGLTSIIVGFERWNVSNVTSSSRMFSGCTSLVGSKGTTYDANCTDIAYAHIDGGAENPGYLTDIDAPYELEAYTILSEDNTVLTFYYDCHKKSRNGMSVGPFSKDDSNNVIGRDWNSFAKSITTVEFNEGFANYRPTSTAYWLYGCEALTTITGIENLKTDNVTDMSGIFSGCSSLTNLDVTNFNTSNVTNMGYMFDGCRALSCLDVSKFNTSNVTDMTCIFQYCSSLSNLDVSRFNTSNVKNMDNMFRGCTSLTSLDVSNFSTSSVTSMSKMFQYCPLLTTLNVSNFNTENVTNMTNMFYLCYGLTSLDLSNFNTSNVTRMSGMFHYCSSLTNICVSTENWNIANVTSSNGMFGDCTSLVGGMGTTYDEDHINIAYAHIDGGVDNPGYLTVVDTDLEQYDNIVYIEGTKSTAGHATTLSLKMNNTIAPTGFQCDVYLPEGVTAAKDEDGFYLMDISTERTTPKKTDYSNSAMQADGGLRFMCSSTKSYTFSGNEGEVAYLTVNIDPDMKEGTYPLILKNIEISDANSNAYRVSYVKTTLKILEYTLGDANNDGSIGVSDFTAIANCIMGTPPANFVEKAADVNADGVISVSDLTGEANIILYGSVAPNVSYAKAPYGYDNRYASIGANDVRALAGEEFTVAVSINGNYEYSGYQFDMNIPEGMNVLNVSREKKGSDLFMSRITDGNTLRVLSASPTGEVSENTVVYVTLAARQEGLYSLDINNAILSADAVTYSMDKSSFMVGIDKGTTGIATVDGMTDGNGVAYDLTGRKVKYDGNAASLKKGIYIINGMKVSK